MARATAKTAAQARPRPPAVRFLLRLPAALHGTLTTNAAQENLSLNEYCVQRLGGPDLHVASRQQVGAVIRRAEHVVGPHLLGVIAHGSWARGEARASSDVDVMVVVDRALKLTRGLYRAWDAEAPTWDVRVVDAHFVHLHPGAGHPSSVWCELAVEGLLLSDRSGVISAALIGVRRAIAQGRLVRRNAHGQPYWTAAA